MHYLCGQHVQSSGSASDSVVTLELHSSIKIIHVKTWANHIQSNRWVWIDRLLKIHQVFSLVYETSWDSAFGAFRT